MKCWIDHFETLRFISCTPVIFQLSFVLVASPEIQDNKELVVISLDVIFKIIVPFKYDYCQYHKDKENTAASYRTNNYCSIVIITVAYKGIKGYTLVQRNKFCPTRASAYCQRLTQTKYLAAAAYQSRYWGGSTYSYIRVLYN